MCVIIIKRKAQEMPSRKTLHAMWNANPDGAGFMYARDGEVIIRKGLMTWSQFESELNKAQITKDDVIVIHFRISTQVRNDLMTQPFAITNNGEYLKCLKIRAFAGLVHNGINQLTTDYNEKEYSDTALFIKDYVSAFVRNSNDATSKYTSDLISALDEHSRYAILNKNGEILKVGDWTYYKGYEVSNINFAFIYKRPKFSFYEDNWID